MDPWEDGASKVPLCTIQLSIGVKILLKEQ